MIDLNFKYEMITPLFNYYDHEDWFLYNEYERLEELYNFLNYISTHDNISDKSKYSPTKICYYNSLNNFELINTISCLTFTMYIHKENDVYFDTRFFIDYSYVENYLKEDFFVDVSLLKLIYLHWNSHIDNGDITGFEHLNFKIKIKPKKDHILNIMDMLKSEILIERSVNI